MSIGNHSHSWLTTILTKVRLTWITVMIPVFYCNILVAHITSDSDWTRIRIGIDPLHWMILATKAFHFTLTAHSMSSHLLHSWLHPWLHRLTIARWHHWLTIAWLLHHWLTIARLLHHWLTIAWLLHHWLTIARLHHWLLIAHWRLSIRLLHTHWCLTITHSCLTIGLLHSHLWLSIWLLHSSHWRHTIRLLHTHWRCSHWSSTHWSPAHWSSAHWSSSHNWSTISSALVCTHVMSRSVYISQCCCIPL